jgi:putative ABC transport system permease protein
MAIVGIYGVIAYSVAQRTREIGIRMALDAQSGEGVGMVVRQNRFMASLLYDVSPDDTPTFAVVGLALAVTAVLASCGPALKAVGVDLLIALRHE